MEKKVSIGELGGEIKSFALEDSETCEDLAEMAGISTDGKTFRVRGSKVDAAYVPNDGDLVLVVKESKGGI